ncbi:MAG: putative transport system permease protein, partial [Candidatus Eremiobacteraeota bacterium]|nr:putative transport system permease protein [Candidatus Eremiobacteraeota bacterium]
MLQYIAEAFAVLAANRVRSFLTALGLIIGVTAVIAIQVLGAGMAGAVGGILGSLNERSFFVFPSTRQTNFTRAAIRLSDLRRARSEVPNVVEAIPGGGIYRLTHFRHKHPRLVIMAEGDARFSAAQPVFGRLFDQDDIREVRHVALISADATKKLGITGDVTGSSIYVGDHRYTIVATLK